MRAIPALLALATLTACAQQPATPLGSGQERGSEEGRIGQHSLEPWRDFPVDADPRPIILLGDPVTVPGFTTGEAKVAFMEGQIDPAGNVPPEAAEAFKRLTKPANGTTPLRVLSVAKGTASFATDRGNKQLPAWTFRLNDTMGDIAVLAQDVQWTRQYATTGNTVSADGLTLTVSMAKADEPCPGHPRQIFTPEVLESRTAVAVGLRTETGPSAPGERSSTCAHDLMLRMADYTVKLQRPLGNRVLVNAQGNPMPVSDTISVTSSSGPRPVVSKT